MADWGCAKRSKTNSGALAAAERLIDYWYGGCGGYGASLLPSQAVGVEDVRSSGRGGEDSLLMMGNGWQ